MEELKDKGIAHIQSKKYKNMKGEKFVGSTPSNFKIYYQVIITTTIKSTLAVYVGNNTDKQDP